jgi:hypothetical protein
MPRPPHSSRFYHPLNSGLLRSRNYRYTPRNRLAWSCSQSLRFCWFFFVLQRTHAVFNKEVRHNSNLLKTFRHVLSARRPLLLNNFIITLNAAL